MDIYLLNTSNPLWMQTLQKLRHDIYHLPEYLELEATRTKTLAEAILMVDRNKIFFLPYLLRKCDDLLDANGIFDIVSPYGYPGILLNDAAATTPEFLNLALQELLQIWHNKQICSAFLRLHPLLNNGFNEIVQAISPTFNGETISIDLKLSEGELWSQTRPEHRTKINRCKRSGMKVNILPFKDYINEFIEIYEETMERVSAPKSYYFGQDYFCYLAETLSNKVHLSIVELDNEIICGGLFTECCGIVQYHLGGTRNKFLKQSPSTLMFDYVRYWAKERGNDILHLGGGVGGSKDSLYHFKAGFSKQNNLFLTLRLIVDEKQYFNLLESRAKFLDISSEEISKSNFFPAYRSYW